MGGSLLGPSGSWKVGTRFMGAAALTGCSAALPVKATAEIAARQRIRNLLLKITGIALQHAPAENYRRFAQKSRGRPFTSG
jgi:hypothetical protein